LNHLGTSTLGAEDIGNKAQVLAKHSERCKPVRVYFRRRKIWPCPCAWSGVGHLSRKLAPLRCGDWWKIGGGACTARDARLELSPCSQQNSFQHDFIGPTLAAEVGDLRPQNGRAVPAQLSREVEQFDLRRRQVGMRVAAEDPVDSVFRFAQDSQH